RLTATQTRFSDTSFGIRTTAAESGAFSARLTYGNPSWNASAFAICFSVARFMRTSTTPTRSPVRLCSANAACRSSSVMRPAWIRHSPIFLRTQRPHERADLRGRIRLYGIVAEFIGANPGATASVNAPARRGTELHRAGCRSRARHERRRRLERYGRRQSPACDPRHRELCRAMRRTEVMSLPLDVGPWRLDVKAQVRVVRPTARVLSK